MVAPPGVEHHIDHAFHTAVDDVYGGGVDAEPARDGRPNLFFVESLAFDFAASTSSEYVAAVLGGAAVFKGQAAPTAIELRARIRLGLPYRSLESVRERLRLSVPAAADLLHMPIRTMARRRQARRLDPDESDRLYRVARVAAHAVAVFGDEEKATTWLHRPNRALHGEPPIRLLDTDVGARHVEDLLGRIEYGIVG